MKALALATALSLMAPAAFASTKKLFTTGTAKLPPVVKVVNKGVETWYYTSGLRSDKFALYDDSNFGIGAQTRCDPFLGRTAEEIKIELNITERKESDFSTDVEKEMGPKGKAMLTIPAGSNAYGRCQNDSNQLTALGLQLATPDGKNKYDGTFALEPVSE